MGANAAERLGALARSSSPEVPFSLPSAARRAVGRVAYLVCGPLSGSDLGEALVRDILPRPRLGSLHPRVPVLGRHRVSLPHLLRGVLMHADVGGKVAEAVARNEGAERVHAAWVPWVPRESQDETYPASGVQTVYGSRYPRSSSRLGP